MIGRLWNRLATFIRPDSGALVSEVDFDPNTLQLTFSSRQPLPKVAPVNHIDVDILGQRAGEARMPGPLADPGAKREWKVDPRAGA